MAYNTYIRNTTKHSFGNETERGKPNMTIKAEKLLNEFTENLDLQIFLYEKEIATFEQAKEEMAKEFDNFETFIVSALHYKMISVKDFKEISESRPSKIYMSKYDTLNSKHYK